MFDFAFSEIALVGVVALLVIGPKDMPVALKAVADVIKKARRMAGEFQGHVDEMVREANLHEVRDTFNDLRSMNIKDKIISAVDGDGTMRRTLSEDPFKTPYPPSRPASPPVASDPLAWKPVAEAPSPGPTVEPPAFVPPAEAAHASPVPPPAPAPPAFIPPDAAAPRL